MALSLNGTLATAQDSTSRKPICSIISTARSGDIPFDGNYFSTSITDQRGPSVVTHSTGGLYCAYTDNGQQDLKLYYTDTDRIKWSNATIVGYVAGHTLRQPTVCEFANGNLGIIYIDNYSNTDYLKYIIINTAGAIITAATTIASYAVASYLIDAPTVLTLSNNTYVLVYEHKNISTGVYSLMERTDTDFISWSAESAVTLTGLTTTRGKYHPFLSQISTDDLFLYFTYVDDIDDSGKELTNIYYAISSDNGATWGTPEAATAYTTFAIGATHPCAVQKEVAQQHLAYTRESGVLHMNKDTAGWDSDGCGSSIGYDWVHYDSSTDKLYVLNIYTATGTKRVCGVNVIDVSTWTVDRSYTSTSLPSYNDFFTANHVWWDRHKSAGHYIVFGANQTFTIINDELETIKLYSFKDSSTYGFTANLESANINTYMTIRSTVIDATNNRCYVLLVHSTSPKSKFIFGYIDLTETAGATGMYTWNEITYSSGEYSQEEFIERIDLIVVPENDYFIISTNYYVDTSTWIMCLLVYQLSTGTRIKYYNATDYGSFHRLGLRDISYQDGCVYGRITYTTNYSQGDRRGIMKVNLSTDTISYHRPSWATLDNYELKRTLAVGNNELIVTSEYGVSFYYTDTDSWFLYDKDNVPGIDPGATSPDCRFDSVYYDRPNSRIFCGRLYDGSYSWYGIAMFYIGGVLKQAYYAIGQYTTQWDWTSSSSLVSGSWNDETVITLDVNNSLWAIWIDGQDSSEFRLKWDKEDDTLDLATYIPDGSEISISCGVDKTNKLTFQLANGYLFDPHNNISTLSTQVQKNRQLNVRFGETVDTVDYWQNQGTFFVTNVKISYKRNEDPIIIVEAEDLRSTWSYANIVATQYYDSSNPVTILNDVLTTHLFLTAGDLNLPVSLENTHSVWHQFLEMTGKDIIDTLLSHFEYVSFMDVDGKVTVKKIAIDNATDHTYPDNTKIINFTPDDDYSTNTNSITVKSETRDYIEVIYDEETVGSLSGTTGWWGGTDTKTIYFSDDHATEAYDPWLNIFQSVGDFEIYGMRGGGSEYISTVTRTYVIVTIEAPDLTAEVLAGITLLITTAVTCYSCDGYVTGYCGWCVWLVSMELSFLIGILGAIATYYYEVNAKPIGQEKQSIEATWNDTESQNSFNGIIIEEEIEDPLCYSVSECQRVADYEGNVTKYQRNRISISKIAHLQDEICDTIEFIHPYSMETIKLFATNITRKFMKPNRTDTGSDGYLIDDIVGWKL